MHIHKPPIFVQSDQARQLTGFRWYSHLSYLLGGIVIRQCERGSQSFLFSGQTNVLSIMMDTVPRFLQLFIYGVQLLEFTSLMM